MEPVSSGPPSNSCCNSGQNTICVPLWYFMTKIVFIWYTLIKMKEDMNISFLFDCWQQSYSWLASNTDSICSKPLLSNLLCILISKFLIYLIDFCRKKVFHHIFSAGGLHHCQRCQMAKDTQSRVDQRIKIRLVNLLQIALRITGHYWLLDWKLVNGDGNAGNIAVGASKWAEVEVRGVIWAKKRAATLLLTQCKFNRLEKSSSLKKSRDHLWLWIIWTLYIIGRS